MTIELSTAQLTNVVTSDWGQHLKNSNTARSTFSKCTICDTGAYNGNQFVHHLKDIHFPVNSMQGISVSNSNNNSDLVMTIELCKFLLLNASDNGQLNPEADHFESIFRGLSALDTFARGLRSNDSTMVCHAIGEITQGNIARFECLEQAVLETRKAIEVPRQVTESPRPTATTIAARALTDLLHSSAKLAMVMNTVSPSRKVEIQQAHNQLQQQQQQQEQQQQEQQQNVAMKIRPFSSVCDAVGDAEATKTITIPSINIKQEPPRFIASIQNILTSTEKSSGLSYPECLKKNSVCSSPATSTSSASPALPRIAVGESPLDSVNSKAAPRRWTKAEDEFLRMSVKKHGEKNWKSIAGEVPGRNHTQCLQRWTKVLAPGLVKGHWSSQEDDLLRELVAAGQKNWGHVAGKIPGRTSKQCRERWYNHLDPSIIRAPYTEAEDQIIIECQAKFGNRWSQIAARLPGRTEDSVKIRWKSFCRMNTKNGGNGGKSSRATGESSKKRRKLSDDEDEGSDMEP